MYMSFKSPVYELVEIMTSLGQPPHLAKNVVKSGIKRLLLSFHRTPPYNERQ